MSAKTQPARGMRDFLPADVRRRNYVINIIREVYERYGFEPLETPAVENIETLMGKYGEEGNQLIFKILKRGVHEATGQADLALRYDLTVPLARVVAEYRDKLPKFFKRYQIQPVWRADRPARGRFREFYQCDVDICGSRSMVVEAELISAVCEVLQRLDFTDFTIRLNHRQVLNGILDAAGVPADKHGDALVALDKLDKIGRESVELEFVARGISEHSSKELLDLFKRGQDAFIAVNFEDGKHWNQIASEEIEKFIGSHEAGQNGLEELRRIAALTATNSAEKHIKVDLSLARGLSYYTGAIMEISVPDLAGSLGGGGRYDNLVGMFSGQDVPACGFSLGLERIIVVMTERGMFPPELTAQCADVMVTLWNEESAADALALAGELRSTGLRVDVYPDADKLGKQFKYASARGIPYVAIVGDSEREHILVSLKNLLTGDQEKSERADAPMKIQNYKMITTLTRLRDSLSESQQSIEGFYNSLDFEGNLGDVKAKYNRFVTCFVENRPSFDKDFSQTMERAQKSMINVIDSLIRFKHRKAFAESTTPKSKERKEVVTLQDDVIRAMQEFRRTAPEFINAVAERIGEFSE